MEKAATPADGFNGLAKLNKDIRAGDVQRVVMLGVVSVSA
jgi:hypothetical protein